MAIRLSTLLALLQKQLASMNLDPSEADRARYAEKQAAQDIFKAIYKLDKQSHFEVDECEELYDSSHKNEEFEPVMEELQEERNQESFSYDYICKVLDFKDKHPNWKFELIRNQFPRVRHPRYLLRFRQYREQMGTQRDRLTQVAKFCKETFDQARAAGCIVHDRTLKMWALQKARELNLTAFTAGHTWIAKFKNLYRISSRRIVRFVTYRNEVRREDIENKAAELVVDYIDNFHGRIDPTDIYNTDQSGFNYQVHTSRTLSYTGERTTLAVVNALGPLTHSYTIQPLLNMAGSLVGKLYINLQEISDEFGPRIAATIPQYPNLYITCTRSGKLNKELVRAWSNNVFQDVINRSHDNKCLLYVDSWGGHKDEELYTVPNKTVIVRVFPEGSTSLVQPLDLYCFRQWKDFAKRLTEYCMLFSFRIDQRNDVLKMHSLIFNQFQHPAFRPMFLCGWRLAGFEVPEVPFPSLSDMLFSFNEDCSTPECRFLPFIRCVYCAKVLCANCFFINYHFCNAANI